MLKLIKGAEVYAPAYLGKKDILFGKTVHAIEDKIEIHGDFIKEIDGTGKLVFPGFIDSHVHILGGGGEGGFRTRTPEIDLTDITTSGITTVVGCLGTDGITRSLKALVAKAKALKEDGITVVIYTGSYRVPVATITGSIMDDIMMIEEIIGVGEIAISDHRSSNPTYDEFLRVISDARVGGMLSGKAGVVNVHMGDQKDGLKYINRMIDETDIPAKQVVPTHIFRNDKLLDEGIEFLKKGGAIDFTTSMASDAKCDKDRSASAGLKHMIDRGMLADNISFSSDGQGSLPEFDSDGKFSGLKVGSCSSLYNEVVCAVKSHGIEIQEALKVITTTPARLLKLKNKGRIDIENDADMVIVDKESLNIKTVIAMGQIMVENERIVSKGIFTK